MTPETIPEGIYKRGDLWWYRIGRNIRRSSGSKNIEDAIALRAKAAAAHNHKRFQSEWEQRVEFESKDSDRWLRTAYGSIQSRSKARGWPSHLTIDELAGILQRSRGCCAITELPFVWDKGFRHPFSISIDRIDSALGYQYGNVRLVLLAVNLAMSHWGEPAIMAISRALVGRELLKPLHNPLHMDIYTADHRE